MATANSNQGIRKAAVLLRSLPKTQRTRLLERLSPEQTEAVTAEMNGLRGVDTVEQAAVVREFAGANPTVSVQPRPAKHAPFCFLYDLPTDALLSLIADEHPQTVAMILSYLPPHQAGAALDELTPDRQMSVVWRIATLDETSSEVIRDVEKGLKRRLSNATGPRTGHRGIASVVRILNVIEPATERRLLGQLADSDPQLLGEIRRVMFGVDVAVYGEQCLV